MRRAHLAAVLVAWLGVSLWAARVHQARWAGARGRTESRPVHLLVARHGLSCANIVEKWISWYDFGRGRMLDPLLGGMGKRSAHEAGLELAQWLAARDYKVDAVLSSNLVRAMETALIMYPNDSKPLYVAPYIREHASGSSNAPKPIGQQSDDLLRALRRMNISFHLDHTWTDVFGEEKAEWPDFLGFLERSFLPDLVSRQHKPDGSPIVLAVVTHSRFMADSLGDCGHLWEAKGARKPLNNQVLHLTYDFHTYHPHPGGMDATVLHNLTRTPETCEEAAAGAQSQGEQGTLHESICLSDIGLECLDDIQSNALSPSMLWDKTSEKAILTLAEDIVALNRETSALKYRIHDIAREIQFLDAFEASDCQTNLFSCSPARFCESSGLTCAKKSAGEMRTIKGSLERARRTHSLDTEQKLLQLHSRKNADCVAGGKPDTKFLIYFLGLKPDRDILKLV